MKEAAVALCDFSETWREERERDGTWKDKSERQRLLEGRYRLLELNFEHLHLYPNEVMRSRWLYLKILGKELSMVLCLVSSHLPLFYVVVL
jgi:hypothetical protein